MDSRNMFSSCSFKPTSNSQCKVLTFRICCNWNGILNQFKSVVQFTTFRFRVQSLILFNIPFHSSKNYVLMIYWRWELFFSGAISLPLYLFVIVFSLQPLHMTNIFFHYSLFVLTLEHLFMSANITSFIGTKFGTQIRIFLYVNQIHIPSI